MADHINMDTKKNPTATVPVLEFQVPISEIDAMADVGERGELLIPVEVIAKNKESITFRKVGKIETQDEFRPETLDSLKEKIGTVDDTEMPIQKAQ